MNMFEVGFITWVKEKHSGELIHVEKVGGSWESTSIEQVIKDMDLACKKCIKHVMWSHSECNTEVLELYAI